jgi:aryl-alcohol dehydrogenase-like predicted oxidoreductase
MRYRRLGRAGLQLSGLSLGAWITDHYQVGPQAAVEMMAAAYDAGGRSEEDMGEALYWGTSEWSAADIRAAWEIAEELGATTAPLAIAWVTKNPRVSSVITGASRLDQLRSNLGALEVADRLTPELMNRIARATAPLADCGNPISWGHDLRRTGRGRAGAAPALSVFMPQAVREHPSRGAAASR